MSMLNFNPYILGTIRTFGRRYSPPETKLLKFCRPNIAKIVFLVSDKKVFFFWVSDLPFCLIRRIREPKNKVGTNFLTNTIYCSYLSIKVDNVRFEELAIPRIK